MWLWQCVLLRYKLADDVDNDIERLRNRHSYRLAASYTSPAQVRRGWARCCSAQPATLLLPAWPWRWY